MPHLFFCIFIMTTSNIVTKAAQELVARRSSHSQGGALASQPTTIEQSLAIQLAIVEQLNERVGGWKCCLPLDNGKVIVAPIFKSTIQSQSPCELNAVNGMAEIENEIAFVFSQNLPAKNDDYSEDEILAAVGSYHMALELMETRFADSYAATYYEKLADSLTNQGMFIGPEITKADALNASRLNVTLLQANQRENKQSFIGQHPNGGAEKPLFWLVNFLSKQGIGVTKGQAVITGSYDGIKTVGFGSQCTVNYENIGEYDISFVEKAN